ncbi:MAG: hypothetical protein QM765_33960 [Myxococcales bacterium]
MRIHFVASTSGSSTLRLASSWLRGVMVMSCGVVAPVGRLTVVSNSLWVQPPLTTSAGSRADQTWPDSAWALVEATPAWRASTFFCSDEPRYSRRVCPAEARGKLATTQTIATIERFMAPLQMRRAPIAFPDWAV